MRAVITGCQISKDTISFLIAIIIAVAIGILLANVLPIGMIVALMLMALAGAVTGLGDPFASNLDWAIGVICLILICVFSFFTNWPS